jgi:hypothetical protein
MWRFLRTGWVTHQAHGIDYERPADDATAPTPASGAIS